MPEVEDDMNVKKVISSDAPKLSLALIQLKLEAFRLGLAQLDLARLLEFSAHLSKIPSLPQPYLTILPIFLEVL